MNEIFFVDFVEENFRCPQAAEVITAHMDEFFFRKMHKIICFPHAQALAARAVDLFPIDIVVFVHAIYDAKIGGEHNKTACVQTCNRDITAALFAKLCRQNGFAAVDFFPVQTVLADRKINLFPVGRQFFFEMCKKKRHTKTSF